MPTGRARATLDEIIRRHNLAREFPKEVQREVDLISRDPGLDDPALADLTGLPFVTIDYPDSMDLDQALQIERNADGYLVRYALADAAHYAPPGSALFHEALRRGVSYYLPGTSVPMLPRELSEGIVSLLPGVPRRAVVFVTRLDRGGQALETSLIRARIMSRAKLSYSGVQAFHDGSATILADQPFTETLELLREVGEQRIADARRRDVIEFDRLETEVELSDERGSGFRLLAQRRNDVSRWNEQISLLCNIEGARLMAGHREGGPTRVQPVFRVHEPPDPAALDRLQRIARRVGQAHGLPPELCRWQRDATPRESLADYLERLRINGAPEAVVAAIERQALLTGQRSVFSSEPGRHYALGVNPYARFSAPMREVVGIFTHKEALETLGLTTAADPARDELLRDRVIDAANAGKERQRRINKDVLGAFIDQLLSGDLEQPLDRRPTREGTVLGVKPSRLYLRLDEPPVELKVYADDLGGAYELLDDVALVPEDGRGRSFTLGDRIALRVLGRDPRGRWRLGPAQG